MKCNNCKSLLSRSQSQSQSLCERDLVLQFEVLKARYLMVSKQHFIYGGKITLWVVSFYILPLKNHLVSDAKIICREQVTSFVVSFCRNYFMRVDIGVRVWIFSNTSVKTSRFSSTCTLYMPNLQNFLNHKAKIIIETAWHFWTKICSFKKDWMLFSKEILE